MSNNAVQPIETSHYTYDAHKPSTTNNQPDSTHHSSFTSTTQPTASKIHPVVDKPIQHPHATATTATSDVVAAPTQHPHAAEHPRAAAAVGRPHAVAEHAQPSVVQHPAHPTSGAVVPSKEKETSKHAQPTAVEHPHPQTETAKSHPQIATTAATSAPHPHVAFEHPVVVVAIPSDSCLAGEHIEDTEEPRPHSRHHHNRSHNHHSQYEGEQAPHKHDYNESPHTAHLAAHHPTSTNANDAPSPSDSVLSESPLAREQPALKQDHTESPHPAAHHATSTPQPLHHDNNTLSGSSPLTSEQHPTHKHNNIETPHPANTAHHATSTPQPAQQQHHHNTNANDALIPSDSILSESPQANSSYLGGVERRHSWSKDEMKRGAMEGLLETEGKRKVAKGGYSSTSPGGEGY
jgi:hypothetical protein